MLAHEPQIARAGHGWRIRRDQVSFVGRLGRLGREVCQDGVDVARLEAGDGHVEIHLDEKV
jgi:hypothetical protein